tara:strand:+ start:383 stop:550 length:168 start_codon:yes stop_codon:yes gene_type:complete
MNITSVKYTASDEGKGLIVVSDSQTLYVPLDPDNRHYAEILKQVEAGTLTIEDAD